LTIALIERAGVHLRSAKRGDSFNASLGRATLEFHDV
jgi:hypothetical protein